MTVPLEGCHIAAIFVLISVHETEETMASLYLMSVVPVEASRLVPVRPLHY